MNREQYQLPLIPLPPHDTFLKRLRTRVAAITVLALLAAKAHGAEDIVIADFEGTNYGGWQVSGKAFGAGPVRGALPDQQPAEGFRGKGFATSFHGGDKASGKLTSPEFKIERKFIGFLIGGGVHPDKACLNLMVEGKIVRSATGLRGRKRPAEALIPSAWDVSEFQGQKAVIEVVDDLKAGGGHINVDHIFATDSEPPGLLPNLVPSVTRAIKLEKRYLNLPVKNDGPKRNMQLLVEGQPLQYFNIELADDTPDWWAFIDVGAFKGKKATLTVEMLPANSAGLKAVNQTDRIQHSEDLYRERLRPQFHFTTRRGWNNDPNGLVFYKGEYHLFYQYNPYGWKWGNMHWGHAVSPDLVHWQELPIALYPDELGTMYSGSAVVDWNNTAGFQTGQERVLVCIFTSAGGHAIEKKPFTQGLAYSNDRGRTWTKYQNNPVLPHIRGDNRDPKVIWYAPEKKWVMALFLDKSIYALYASPDLKQWEKLSDIAFPGTSECPEFFEIPLDGKQQATRWVFYGGNGRYLIGKFDGRTFTPETEPYRLQEGNCWYASQTYTDIPPEDGRRILVPWGQKMDLPGMPFSQMMGIPVELTLCTTEEGPRLLANPVKELASLRTARHTIAPQTLKPGENPLAAVKAELLDLDAELAVGEAAELGFVLHGVTVRYDTKAQELTCLDRKAALKPIDGKIRLRLMVDRTSIDIFGNGGRLYMPMAAIAVADSRDLEAYAKGGNARIKALEIYELKSAWK